MANETTKGKIFCTTQSHYREKDEVNELLLGTKLMPQDRQARETEWTWITQSPCLKGVVPIPPTYALYSPHPTEASLGIKMEALKVKHLKGNERNDSI